jgi:carboxypeptidase Q
MVSRLRLSTAALLLVSATAVSADDVNLAIVHRIKAEAFQNSQVMDHLFYLTDVHGPRLTASPGFEAAAAWAVERLKGWGLQNVKQEAWGSFGRAWSLKRFSAHMLEPSYAPLPGMPKAWSAGTSGAVSAEVIAAPLFEAWESSEQRDVAKLEARIERYSEQQRSKLAGRIVLLEGLRELRPPTEAASRRLDQAELGDLATAPEPFKFPPYEWPLSSLPGDPKLRQQLRDSLPTEVEEEYWAQATAARAKLNAFLRREAVVAVLTSDQRSPGAILFAEQAGPWQAGAPVPPPVIALAPEPYARIYRMVEHKIPVRVEIEVAVDFPEEPRDGRNLIAEIPGGKKKDEVVMLGAHLDSWHSGTGATDNGAGSAVVIEAMRILKTLALPMDRSVRLALWSGEEQGLFGSRGYVKEHFGDPVTMALKPEHARLAGYFNIDNGSGKIRGVYLQGNDMVRPIFEGWLAPFRDMDASTLSIRNTDGTDHLSFDAVGLPGFQFIQDPLDYDTRTHHSNIDVYDHLQPGDLMQASAILASFVYNAATRPEMLPRKPLPAPLPKRRDAPAN